MDSHAMRVILSTPRQTLEGGLTSEGSRPVGIRYPYWTMTARAVPLRTGATASRRPITILALLLAFGLSAAHAAPIHTAARARDVDKVRELLDQGADINRNSRNGTPLHVAVLADRQEVVERLIADVAVRAR